MMDFMDVSVYVGTAALGCPVEQSSTYCFSKGFFASSGKPRAAPPQPKFLVGSRCFSQRFLLEFLCDLCG
jgi:hypothetical protein